jgi:dihydrofolate reductase
VSGKGGADRSVTLVLVAAVADNGVIGRDNALPWRLRADMQRFRALTMGKPVIMGRKTYLSIGKPLDGRTNIVASRDASLAIPGALVAPSLETALEAARGDALRRAAGEIIVAGGADIYSAAMPLADRLEITHVHVRPDGDTHFPAIDPSVWREIARQEPPDQDAEARATWVTYTRRDAAGRKGDNHR